MRHVHGQVLEVIIRLGRVLTLETLQNIAQVTPEDSTYVSGFSYITRI